MIDNHAKTMELMEKMKAQLPIPARPTRAFARLMREKGVKMKPNQDLQIENVLYMGDEGGISCGLQWPGRDQEETAVVTSLTHIRVKAGHPLAKDIRAYQVARTQKLAQIDRQSGPRITFK